TTEQQQQLSELLQTQRRLGFQFNQAPLMGCTLVRLDEDNYKFIWSHHHILMDGWCLPIIFKEVISFYEAEVTDETFSLPTPTPYGDYIAWLNSQNQEIAFEFWRQTLQGFSAPTPLVVDNNQYQKEYINSDYKELELTLSAQTSRGLQDLAQQHHVTLSTIVQAVWALLLSRYSDEKDVVFGVIVSGRPSSLSGVEKMVGLFINTLPLRLQISPQQQLISWLQQIQQLMLELQDYSYTPLVEIQSMSEVTRGTPLFESIVVFENYPVDSSLLNQSNSLKVTEIGGFEQNNYPLTVVAVPRDELLIKISYDTVRFELDTIERMLGHLQTIFCAIVENPSQTVGELPLLTQAERHQLLTEWNDTATEYPTDKCIHQLFEQQVDKTPHCVAVVFENQQLTYQQLNQRANQLAYHLQSLGVGAEILVGICVERSIEMLVGLLGILKAGGAYLPFDSNYPQERLSYMLEDSAVQVLLTQQSLLQSLPQHQAQVVCLDADWVSIEQYSHHNLDVEVASDNLAYVIYTSGSTGQPKGVEICHYSVVNFLNSMSHFPGLTQEDTFYAVTTISFDIAALELYLPLTVGAKVIVASRSIASNADSLLFELFKSKITVMQATPVTWQMLLAGGWSSNYPLKVLCGGEALSAQLAHQILETGSELWNLYGPTEATIWSTIYQLGTKKTVARTENAPSPIGRPIANTQIYILDSHLQPVPIGVPGELYISGDGLARSYLNRPELTQEKFIPSPFSNSKHKRLYKTGDLACYGSDGSIKFRGRIDNQVKVRGFRIELGEIESVLNTHPQIQQAVVTAREDIPGNKRLVAYIVIRDELLTTDQLREFIKQKLPEYMVPSAFVTLDILPLTANGKVDRKALPTPDQETFSNLQYIPPRNRTEEVIANIFASVLSIEKVGIYDNFFTLGGHSLLATQVISRVKQAFAVDVPLRNLFEEPTIANLSKIIDNSDSTLVQQLQTTPFDQLQNREEIEL
ncbi:amino acid adenylation domain-containing protein, partial [Komarekiella sp. 'clone 1']